jgi:hypothetical protein
MRRACFLAIPFVLAVSACGGSQSLSAKSLDKRVLQQRDVGAAFESFNSGPQVQLDNQGTPRADPSRFGREGGWIARFHRGGSPHTRGPLVVESRVDVFKSSGGAESDFAEYKTLLGDLAGARTIPPPQLGDEAAAVTFTQAGALPLRFYRIAWRYRNATASVTVEGFDKKVTEPDAVALARKQQARLQHG